MAKAISDEELQLKKRARRRLVGAIALVLLVVVFLPMFLDSEPKPLNQDIAINIPPIPNPETTPPPSGPPPVAGMPQQAAPAEPAPTVQSAPPPAPETAVAPPPGPEPAVSEPKPKPQPEARPVAKPAAPKHEAKPAAGADAYVVQLGAFSNAANAKALQKKLQENKFKAYTELLKSPGGDRTRVRVGPYATRDAADKARDQLKSRKLIIGDATVVRQGD
jgi:DedD protein